MDLSKLRLSGRTLSQFGYPYKGDCFSIVTSLDILLFNKKVPKGMWLKQYTNLILVR